MTVPGRPISVDAFRLHHIPSEDEVLETIALIAYEESELERYDDLVTRLRAGADELEKERAELKKRLMTRYSFISAIRRLPVELIANIFSIFCDAEPYSLLTRHDEHIHTAPIVLSQVSSRWRRIAHSMPDLWNTISVDVYRPRKDLVPLLNLHLKNARTHPLDVRVTALQSSPADLHFSGDVTEQVGLLGQHGIAVLRTLMGYAAQFTKLELDIDAGLLGTFTESLPNVSFPS
ncbi:hypothetical protein MPER_08704, partial [Moniliophthora perniciosa FA553]